MVLGGPESEGHLTGEAMKALFAHGVDEKKRIIGTKAPHPFLYNIPSEFIIRLRKQITLVDCQFQEEGVIRQAVWACYQEKPVEFREHHLCDPGAYPESPYAGKITWRVTQPWAESKDEAERAAKQKALDLIERLKARGDQLRKEKERKNSD
jgi:tetrahydromethanopterin S-methyltransferase subunit A